ncbi:fasciclin domain-containing protein [Bacteroidota bacterium]
MKITKKIIHNILPVNLFLILLVSISCREEPFELKPFYEGNKAISMADYIRSKTLVDSFHLFSDVITATNMERTLSAYNPNGNNYTLFLPTDKAFDEFIATNSNYNSFQDLLNDKEYVNALIRYHLVNIELEQNEFPYGALPDTTVSGFLLTVAYTGTIDSIIRKVNGYAKIIKPDIELSNGYIHVIDRVLTPVVYNAYNWLAQYPACSIFTRALEITGLKDTFNIMKIGSRFRYPTNSVLVESNTVFRKEGIHSIEDLISKYSPDKQNYTSYENSLYQFAAYHILENIIFLNDLEGANTNFNTYGSFPISVNSTGLDIKVNRGVEQYDTIDASGDTIDYVSINYEASNVSTLNGGIHFINQVMEVYKPPRKTRTFEFTEEPVLKEAFDNPNLYEFDDIEEFELIKWKGVESIEYRKFSSNVSNLWNNDYLRLEGDFSISYVIPKVLPGRYMLQIRADDQGGNNAIILVYLDGKNIGGSVDLTSNPSRYSDYNSFEVGVVEFDNYETHFLEIQTLLSGLFTWDAVRFEPVN